MPRRRMDDWKSPRWIMELLEIEDFWADPCPIGGLENNPDDLEGEWQIASHLFGIYINPPYSDPKPWVKKAIRTHLRYETKIVMLLKHDSSTAWFRMLQEAGAEFLFPYGRLTFEAAGDSPNAGLPASFPSVLAGLV